MPRTILKDYAGLPLNLDGSQVIVKNDQNQDTSLETELVALRAKVAALAACSDALVFMGIITSAAPLPESGYKAGWTYKIGEAGLYAGQQCEAGDMAICLRDYVEGSSGLQDWMIIQANIDGAVTGPASSLDGDMAVFSGTSGKIIADSGLKNADLSQAVTMRHQHANSGTLALFGQNSEGELTFSGQQIGMNIVACAVIHAGDELPPNFSPQGVIFEIQD